MKHLWCEMTSVSSRNSIQSAVLLECCFFKRVFTHCTQSAEKKFIQYIMKTIDFKNLFFLFLDKNWSHFSNLHIILRFLQFWCFTSQIWYDYLFFLNFIRFPDFSNFFPDVFRIFFRIFSGFFPDFSRFSGFEDFLIWNKSLLCSRSRTLRI